MNLRIPNEVVSTWFGSFLLVNGTIAASVLFPPDLASLSDRLRARRDGRLAPEETALLARAEQKGVVTRDRRFLSAGVKIDPAARGEVGIAQGGWSGAIELRSLLLEEADWALRRSWDPTVHVEEAVRASNDLDSALNELNERVSSWRSRDALEETGDSLDVVGTVSGPGSKTDLASDLAPDPGLLEARETLRKLVGEMRAARRAIEAAVEATVPKRMPNLSALLGPMLAGRMVAQAGGLARLARLPASTIQVLGAERAFFEHLRGRATPPRHGLLFVHPKIQSAPRIRRGRLARALAGKVAIAARLDYSGAPVDPRLAKQFQSRADEIERMAKKPIRTRRLHPPLHRTAKHS